MAVAVIIDRIRQSLAAGELAPKQATAAATVTTIGDLLQPWSNVYPGVDEPEEDGVFSLFDNGTLSKVSFVPRARTSRRSLPVPRRIPGGHKLINPGLFASVQGIWDWYRAQEAAAPSLLAHPFTEQGMWDYIQILFQRLVPNWPMAYRMETLFDEASLLQLGGIPVVLPHCNYEEEGVGIIEGFLSGVDGITSCMKYVADKFEDLAPKDKTLIEKIGYHRLLTAYAQYKGQKSYDIVKLDNFGETFFGPVEERFPGQMKTSWPIISDSYGDDAELLIRSREDIEFSLAYADAYYAMLSAMPNAYDFENNDGGIAEKFAAELCDVWRKTRNKPPVDSPAPAPNPLSSVFQEIGL